MEPFYGKEINCSEEQLRIQKILSKYRSQPVSEELKKTIYNELSGAKERGEISIPFKVVMRHSDSHHRPYIEVILDTKV